MKKTIFTGSGTALITPFKDNGKKADYDFFETLCDYQIKNHTDALIIAGTTGESPVLSKDEKKSLFEIAVKTSNGKIPVIAGTGSNNTEEAVKKSNEAEKMGVNALLVVTPYYNKCTQEGIIEHYFYIANRVSSPLIVYNVPSRTGVNILPKTYEALSEHKNIIAVKEANGNLSSVAETISLCGDRLDIYSGNDDQTVAINSLGGKGVISVAANIIPEEMHRMASKREDSQKLQLYYFELMKELFCEVNPIPVKAAIEMLWQKEQPLRLPLTNISDKNREKLKNTLIKYNLI
ncbi:MAG: 4-hydroxy-tetrahydrodipicolinate synthase [Oscillospiraceae bacterium]|nr:4-hydroxy-tetrahydrodipicolinate synthase [Oscillospiraceae bacterium]